MGYYFSVLMSGVVKIPGEYKKETSVELEIPDMPEMPKSEEVLEIPENIELEPETPGTEVKEIKPEEIEQEMKEIEAEGGEITGIEILEGAGRMLEGEKADAVTEAENILDVGIKAVEEAIEVVNGSEVARNQDSTEMINNPKEINIHGKINTELDEVDLVNKIIYEDKSASKLHMDNPDFPQTELQWAYKQIYKKGLNRINALQQPDFTITGNGNLPDAETLRNINNYVFRIDADTPKLRFAVNKELDNLKLMFPDYNFSAQYGGKK